MNSKNSEEHWGIVGGGIMGMTLALRLAKMGKQVTILEASPSLGGLTKAVDRNGIVWDAYYHVILLSDLKTRGILSEIGLEKELVWAETKTGFYSEGQLYSMSNMVEYFRFPPINIIGKFRLGVTIVLASIIRNWRRMEEIPVEVWLKRWSGKKVFNKIWLPLLKAKLGDHYKETSANFIWATIQRMYAARRSGLKKEMFGYVKGGYEQIITSFEEKLHEQSVKTCTNTQIREISEGIEGTITVRTNEQSEFKFDKVISTLPSDLSAAMAPKLSDQEIKLHNNIKYLGVICPSILLKKSISEYYITNIIDKWTPFTGIIEMTALIDPNELEGHHLVYLPKYVSPDNDLHGKTDEELKEFFLDGLIKMYPNINKEDIIQWTIAKAKRVFALPTIGYSKMLPDVKTSINGYYIINSAQIINGTLNVNDTIAIADEKLEIILLENEQ